MHPTLSLGDYELDVSPYEDTVTENLENESQQTEHTHTRCAGPAGAGVWEGLDPGKRVASGEHSWVIREVLNCQVTKEALSW